MRINSKLILLLACVGMILATPVWADVPENMNVQGRLADAAGDPLPPGFKIFTFKIWDAEVGGTEVWPGGPGEVQTIGTDDDGLWTAQIGKLLGLTDAVFQDTTRWLEVTIDDNVNPVETLPRIKLNTNPFTYRSASSQNSDLLDGLNSTDFAANAHGHAPADITPQGSGSTLDADLLDGNHASAFAGIGHNHDAAYVNEAGDTLPPAGLTLYQANGDPGILFAPESGAILTYGNDGLLQTRLYDGAWGELDLWDESASNDNTVVLTATSNSGGQLYLRNNTATVNTIVLDGGQTGDASVRIPSGAINRIEILDEPGIASQQANIFVVLSSTSSTTNMIDLETVTITIPTSGWIRVEANAYAWFSGAIGQSATAHYQIAESSTGSHTLPYFRRFGVYLKAGVGNEFGSLNCSRIFFKSAGTYTFRVEVNRDVISTGATVNFGWPILTATFYTTSYGAVNTIVASGEAGDFEHAEAVQVDLTDIGSLGESGVIETLYKVDLRELEVRAARAEAAAQEAMRDLLEAQSQVGQTGTLNRSIGDQQGDE